MPSITRARNIIDHLFTLGDPRLNIIDLELYFTDEQVRNFSLLFL